MIYRLLVAMIFLCTLGSELQAQIDLDSLRQANTDTKVPLSYLLGKWVSTDSLGGEIEFVDEGHQVIIEPRTHVQYFTFRAANDSVFVTGTAMNWPPYDCILIPKDEGTLEIKYFNYISSQTYDQVYYRK